MTSNRKTVRPVIERTDPFKNNPELFTETIFLIGNGKSRGTFDLERLRGKGTIIGCNALYRDFIPDLLICIDTKMLLEVHKKKYTEENLLLMPMGRSTKITNALIWRVKHFNTSGCFALQAISYLLKPKYCYMLGMDGYPGNVYDGTVNYSANSLQKFDTVIDRYKSALSEEVNFINVNHRDAWNCVIDNYKHITYGEFEAKVMA